MAVSARTGRAPRQQQIGDIGAGDQQHQPRDAHEQPQSRGRLGLQNGNSAAGRRYQDLLFADARPALRRNARLDGKPLLQLSRDLRLNAGCPDFRFHPSDDVQPMETLGQQCIRSIKERLGGQRQPEIRRIGNYTIPEKARRSDASNRVGGLIDGEGGADHRSIQAEMLLPGAIAHHRHRRGAGPIVRGRNRASRERADAERREVIARNELSCIGLRGSMRPATACAQLRRASLERGHLAELRRVIAELLIERIGVNVPVVLESPDHAAIVATPEAVQLFGVLDRQGLQHDGVYQGKDGRVGPNAQSQRQHADNGKPRRLPQPAECIAKILHQLHGTLLVDENMIDEASSVFVRWERPSLSGHRLRDQAEKWAGRSSSPRARAPHHRVSSSRTLPACSCKSGGAP
jgi:hypothetical protein